MSTSFRNAALALLREIGINDPPDSYMDDLVALNHACSLCAREMAGESFVFKLPPLPRTDNDAPLYAGSLHRAVRFCANDAARKFVLRIDELSGRRCSILMLQILLAIQEGYQPAVNTSGGES